MGLLEENIDLNHRVSNPFLRTKIRDWRLNSLFLNDRRVELKKWRSGNASMVLRIVYSVLVRASHLVAQLDDFFHHEVNVISGAAVVSKTSP